MIAIYYVALIILICPLNTIAFYEVTAVESQALNRRRNTHQYRNRNERSRIFNENNADVLVGHMPKIELHAHLHGSIRRSTLESLASARNISLQCDYALDLEQCFGLFKIVHLVISTQSIVRKIFHEIMEDYMSDNIIYLEIRTSPRSLPDGTTIHEYISLLIDIIAEHNDKFGDKMLVKLILSVDRSKGINIAVQTMQIIEDIGLHHKSNSTMLSQLQKIIVGLDFSGNPLGGRFEDFTSVFSRARVLGLKITVHCAETKQLSQLSFDQSNGFIQDETSSILDFKLVL